MYGCAYCGENGDRDHDEMRANDQTSVGIERAGSIQYVWIRDPPPRDAPNLKQPPQDFGGPMAKQHRMAALTLGCLAALVESSIGVAHSCLQLTLVVIAAGSLGTAVMRTLMISSQLASWQP